MTTNLQLTDSILPEFKENENIKIQVFQGKPYHFTIWSKDPLINLMPDGQIIYHDGDLINMTEDMIELKLTLKKGTILK
jgi:hypothetical protein